MSYLVDYSNFRSLLEQASSTPSVAPADFIVAASATKVPMRDAALNQNQGYPLVDGSGEQDMHIYELGLGAAAAGKFSMAKAGEKVTQDTIEFDGKQITDTGKLIIEWNAENMKKSIKASGNGALVLARAASQLMEISNKGAKVGVIILELGASSRYATRWSIDKSLGITPESLRWKQNTLAAAMSKDAVNATDLPKFQALRAHGKGWDFKGNFDNNGGIWLDYKDLANGSASATAVYPPQKSEQNNTLAPYYRKYAISDLVINGNLPSPKLKEMSTKLVGIVNTDLDNLSAYIPQFLKEKMTGIEDQYINRLAKRTQEIIAASKSYNTESNLSRTAVAQLTQKDGDVSPAQSGSPAQDTKEFASGKS